MMQKKALGCTKTCQGGKWRGRGGRAPTDDAGAQYNFDPKKQTHLPLKDKMHKLYKNINYLNALIPIFALNDLD